MSIYYVALTGNDANSGSESSPWRNPPVGASRLSAGDTLFHRAGTYATSFSSGSIAPGTSWANKVRLAAYPGETVWIKPPAGHNRVMEFAGVQQYIEIDGLNLDGESVNYDVVKINGIAPGNNAHHIRIQNATLLGTLGTGDPTNGGMAFHVLCTMLQAGLQGGNEFINLSVSRGGGGSCSTCDFSHAFYIQSGGNLVEFCDISDVKGNGVELFNGYIFNDGVIANTVRYNRIHDITSATGRHRGVVVIGDRNKIYGNLIYNIVGTDSGGFISAGIHLLDATNTEVYNNTVYGCHRYGILVELKANTNILRNNIVDENTEDTRFDVAVVESNNFVGGDPEFVDAGGDDFRLLSTSDAIDAGFDTSALVTIDLDGGERPFGAGMDIGAYEFGAEPGSPPVPPPDPGSPAEASPAPEPEPSPIPPGGVSSAFDVYSDHDMQDPADYYGGFKEGRVLRFGDGERKFSEMFTGEWSGSTFELSLSDYDRRFRQQLNSATDRNWVEPIPIRMTTRANRAVLGTPYTVFVGPIIDIGEMKSSDPLKLDLTLGDIISEALLSDDYQLPWRVIRDGFIDELDEVAEALDLDAPEPIIYGQHRRVPDVDPASPQGFQVTPIYLGIEGGYHVWMVCGHACADIPEVLVWTPDEFGGLGTSVSVLADGDWLIPHTSAPAYEDRHSVTYGNDRRYTLIRGLAGTSDDPTDADACAIGDKTLTCFVDGVEPIGDGTGDVITDRFQQYKHFLINFVANRGPQSYQSGAWLDNPTWDLFDGPVPIIEEDSFDACSLIAEGRLPLPTGSPAPDYAAGYIGAAIIGARASDRASVRKWIADWNRSCQCSFGPTHFGQIRVSLLHPTAAIKAAAPLYTDAYEILQGSFGTRIPWREKVNRVPWRADYEYTSGQWKTSDIASIDAGITQYGRELLGEIREYPFAPGETAANHLAQLEGRVRVKPLRFISLEATVGHDHLGDSLGYRDLGDYIRYKHFDAVSASKSETRLAYVVAHQVQAGARRVRILALDVEEYIGFDEPDAFSGVSPGNDTCSTAVVIPPAEIVNYTTEIDTTEHAEDLTVDGLCGSPAGAFHAAWFEYTPAQAQKGHVTTGLSGYDTILGVFTGECESLVLEDCNDNDGIFTTSFIEFTESNFLLPGVTYRFLVTGRAPSDGGKLVFTLFLEPL